LREQTTEQEHFAVLGGGFIGAEIAAALSVNGKKVTMVFPEAAICGLIFPKEFALALDRYYQNHGVTVLPGSKPCRISGDRGQFEIQIENGHKISADAVVAGIGISPQTELASNAGLAVDDGIIVDEQLRTRNPDIFAAGDAARFYNPLLGKRMRVEHEDNALTMGETAGRNMSGEKELYHHLPFFYSDLFDAGYEAVGETDSSMETVTRLNQPEDKGCIFYLQDGRVRGVVFWNVFGKVDAGRELIAAPGPHSADGLRDWEENRLAD
jgi:NADPH-dependent 2,4-dienoyl-CoA reductase/sulfur reductase-like enzyme